MRNDDAYHEHAMGLYDQDWRYYHGRDHVKDVHTYARALRALYGVGPEKPFSLERAIDLHDVIYVPGKTGSEEASAMLADSYNSPEVGRLIRLTEFHMAGTTVSFAQEDIDACFICDADLYGLAMPWYYYATASRDIREEYAEFHGYGAFSEDFNPLWEAGRAKWIRGFLDRPRIFHGPGTNMLEQQARDNLRQELENLSVTECNHVYGMGIHCTRCGE